MKTHEELVEDFENAKFALLMEEVMRLEGEELIRENERLKNDPSAAVPEGLDRKCIKTIHRAFAKQRRQEAAAVGHRVLQRVSIAVFAVVFLFSAVYAVSPKARLATLNFLVQTSDVATGLTFADADDKTQGDHDLNTIAGYSLPDMPEGFYLFNSMSDNRSERKFYENGQDASITIQVIRTTDTAIHNIDTEATDSSEKIIINGYDGILVEKDGRIQITIADKDNLNFIDIVSNNVATGTVLDIAKGIQWGS